MWREQVHKCADCGYRGPEVAESPTFKAMLCDECFTERNDSKEAEIIAACYPVNE